MDREDKPDEELMVMGFMLGDASFGVDALLVQEVVKVGEITRVHGAAAGVIGVRNLRGRIVTVVDMARHLGLGCVTPGPESRLLIMEADGEAVGFLVDLVTDANALDRERIGPLPASLDPALRSQLCGVWRDGDRLIALLESQTLFRWDDPDEQDPLH